MLTSASVITTFMLLLSAAIAGGTIAVVLRLPTVVGYILGGVVISSLLSAFIDVPLVTIVADVGVTLLLFTIGVEFSFHKLKKILSVVAGLASAQILFMFIGIFGLFLLFGQSYLSTLYLASAAALSSTAIIIKILSEKGERDSLHGELATGWLVIQDLAVVPILIILTAVSNLSIVGGSIFQMTASISWALGISCVVIGSVLYFGKVGVPKLLSAVAGFANRELFLLVTIGVVFFVGIITSSIGLSIALGAFLAGLLVAETSQNHAVFAEIRPLRDVFAVVFFVSLGMSLPVASVLPQMSLIIGSTIVIIVSKMFVVYGLLRFKRYHRKTAFLVSLSLSPMSELGFVLAQTGLHLGVISQTTSTLLMAITFMSILIAAPLMSHGVWLYYRFMVIMRYFPKFFGQDNEDRPTSEGVKMENHVVLCGYGRVGKYIGRALSMEHIPFIVVDINQAVLKNLKEEGVMTVYGDPADRGVLDFAQVDLAKALVVAIPDRHTQEMVITHALSLNRRIKIICRTHYEEDQKTLKALGVQTVVQPEFEAAVAIVSKLMTNFGVSQEEINGKINRLKIVHGLG